MTAIAAASLIVAAMWITSLSILVFVQQELEDLNSPLREKDKMKDDAMAHLSDQLLSLSTRLQEQERKQQTTMLTSK